MSNLLSQASLVMIPSGYKEDVVYSAIPTNGNGDLSFTRASNGTRVNSAGLVEVVPWNILEYSEDFANAYWYAEAGNTVTSNSTTAPNGTLTADTLTATATNVMNVHNYASFTITANTYTLSQYLKSNGTNLIESYIYNTSTGFVGRGEINFANGTFTASVGSGSIENVGNGWYRISLTASLASGSITTGFFTTSTTGTRTAFVWGAQLNIGSTAKPYFPTTDRLNVPRLTYQNGGGGCPSLLLEKQSTNVNPYSNEFDNADWEKTNTTITVNATTSPDGTTNAAALLETTANGFHRLYDNGISVTSGTAYTISLFVKANGRNWFAIEFFAGNSAFNGSRVWFDIANGTIGTIETGITASIENFGNGWYRIQATQTAAATTTGYLLYLLATADQVVSYAGDVTKGAFVYGAQTEASSYPTSYIPTTSSSATRVADACSKTGISSLIGQTEGVVFYDGVLTGISNPYANLINSEKNTTGSFSVGQSNTGEILATLFVNGNAIVNFNFGSFAVDTRTKIAFAYKSGSFALYVNGTQLATSAATFTPIQNMDDIFIGDVTTYFNYKENTQVNQVALFPTRLTNAELASLTTI